MYFRHQPHNLYSITNFSHSLGMKINKDGGTHLHPACAAQSPFDISWMEQCWISLGQIHSTTAWPTVREAPAQTGPWVHKHLHGHFHQHSLHVSCIAGLSYPQLSFRKCMGSGENKIDIHRFQRSSPHIHEKLQILQIHCHHGSLSWCMYCHPKLELAVIRFFPHLYSFPTKSISVELKHFS